MQYYAIINRRFDDSKFSYGEHGVANYKTGEAKICKDCGSFISMLEWLPPLEVKVSKKNLGDFIFGTYTGFVVSKNFKVKFEVNNDLKSLNSFKEVSLYYKGKLLDESYYYPNIPLIEAFIDINRIGFEVKELCITCQKGRSIISKINGILFLDSEQIVEDVFFTTALGQSVIILSENFKIFVEKEGFTNLKILDASKFRWDSLNPIYLY